MSKAHAEHNERACDFLIADGSFTDWVVTTAFYSALHFVQNEMFPYTDASGKSYTHFDNYYTGVLKVKNRKLSKHTGTLMMLKKEIPSCSSQYRWLMDACMNSRYKNYRFPLKKHRQLEIS